MPVETLDKRRAMTQMSDGENLLEGVMLSQSADVLQVTSRTPFRILGSASIGDDLALTRNIVAMSAAEARQSPTRHSSYTIGRSKRALMSPT